MPTGTDADLVDLLTSGVLTPVGRIVDSSNGALLCSVEVAGDGDTPGADSDPVLVIHKPEASERPLWDYPDGTLVARERAAYLVSAAGGFDVVPPTVLRNGPLGPGSVQLWIGPVDGVRDVCPVVVCTPNTPDPTTSKHRAVLRWPGRRRVFRRIQPEYAPAAVGCPYSLSPLLTVSRSSDRGNWLRRRPGSGGPG